MPTASDVTPDTDTLAPAAHNGRPVLVREPVNIVHLSSAADGDGIAGDDGMAALFSLPLVVGSGGKGEGVLMEGEGVEVVQPDGEGTRRVGAAKEVVAGGLDVEPDVVFTGWHILVSHPVAPTI